MHTLYEVRQEDAGPSSSIQPDQQTPAQARVYAIFPRDHGASDTVAGGIFLITSFLAQIFFWSITFISHYFVHYLHLVLEIFIFLYLLLHHWVTLLS